MTLIAKGITEGLTEKSTQPAGSRKFYIGAAWDGDVDLDLCVQPIRDNQMLTDDTLYFNRTEVYAGALTHSGDALTGDDTDGDDESIVVNTDALPATVTALIVGVIAYNVDDMSAATNTKFTVRDGADDSAPELHTLPMSDDDTDGETVLVACVLVRGADGNWTIRNVSEFRTEFGKGMEALSGFVGIAGSYAQAA